MKLKELCLFSMIAIIATFHHIAIAQRKHEAQIVQESSLSEHIFTPTVWCGIIAWWFFAVHFQHDTYQAYLEYRSLVDPRWTDPFSNEFLTIASNLEN